MIKDNRDIKTKSIACKEFNNNNNDYYYLLESYFKKIP